MDMDNCYSKDILGSRSLQPKVTGWEKQLSEREFGRLFYLFSAFLDVRCDYVLVGHLSDKQRG